MRKGSYSFAHFSFVLSFKRKGREGGAKLRKDWFESNRSVYSLLPFSFQG